MPSSLKPRFVFVCVRIETGFTRPNCKLVLFAITSFHASGGCVPYTRSFHNRMALTYVEVCVIRHVCRQRPFAPLSGSQRAMMDSAVGQPPQSYRFVAYEITFANGCFLGNSARFLAIAPDCSQTLVPNGQPMLLIYNLVRPYNVF